MFELNNGTVTWGGKEVSKLAASVLGDAAIQKERESFETAMDEVMEFEPFRKAMKHYMAAENIYERGSVFNQKTPEEVKDAWDFWVWFEGQAKGFIERIPHVQGCGWAAYKADAARFTHKAYLRLSGDDNITEVLRPFGYISKIGNLALKVTGDLEPDAEELGDEELGEALEGAMRPRIDPQADPVSQILQAMGLA